MLAAIVSGKDRLELREIHRPEPNDYQCLARVEAAATCNHTDMVFLRADSPKPRLLGHETVGRIVSVGAKVRHFKEGDLVLRPCAIYPGQEMDGIGSALGGFAEYGLVTDVRAAEADGFALPPGEQNYAIYQQLVPPTIESADATMLITLKETLSWTERLGIGPRDGVLIFGDGPVAGAMARMAKIQGAWPVIVAGHHDHRLARAQKLGADLVVNTARENLKESVERAYGPRPVKFITDAVGKLSLINEALPLLAENGVYGIYGLAEGTDVIINRRLGPREWSYRSLKINESSTHQRLLDQVRCGLVNLRDLYDTVMPFCRIAEAFQLLRERKAYKIVLRMTEET